MNAQEYVELREDRGATVRRVQGGWVVTCPGHEDRTPSLSVSIGRDDLVVLHCHAGCDVHDVLAADGLDWPDLFPDDGKRNGRVEVAAYDYVDEQGALLFQCVRFYPKDFKQRRPDGRGGWIWSLKDARRVLYRLPRVIEAVAAGEAVYVAEGEKDVLAVERAGAVATCNPMGAGKGKWKAEFSEALRGANVIVVADRDKDGREHARRIVASLDGVPRRSRSSRRWSARTPPTTWRRARRSAVRGGRSRWQRPQGSCADETPPPPRPESARARRCGSLTSSG